MRKAAAISVVATIVLLAGWKFIPYLRGAAPAIDSTPSVQPFEDDTTVDLMPRQRLCIDHVRFGRDSRFAQLLVERKSKPKMRLTAVATAPGYHSSSLLHAEGAPSSQQTARLRPITGPDVTGSVCVLNDGHRAIAFFAVAPGQGSTASRTTVDGRPAAASVSLTLLSSLSQSRLANLPNVVDHAAALGPLAPWVIWILILLVVIGVPAALAVALARSV